MRRRPWIPLVTALAFSVMTLNVRESVATGAAANMSGAPPAGAPSQTETSEMATFNLKVGDASLTATYADTAAARELSVLLSGKPLTVQMRDHGGFEKVGSLGQSLTAGDTRIRAVIGDIMLYQGNQMVIFYGTNTWGYTRLGKIMGITPDGLRDVLGRGDVTAVLSAGN